MEKNTDLSLIHIYQTDFYLIDSWISGTDGVYTEKDAVNGLIPEGFSQGDLKPHYLYHLSEGYYYLVEQKAPAYYKALVPVKLYCSGTKSESVQIAVSYTHLLPIRSLQETKS